MNVIYSVKDYVSNVFHQDSGSDAIDVVAVQQPDGLLHCSPFHVHFGSVHRPKQGDKRHQITLEVNGRIVHGVHMKLGAAGEAYFVHHVNDCGDEQDYSSSPLPSPPSSIGEANDSFVADGPLENNVSEPEDEEDAVQRRLACGWSALPLVHEANACQDDDVPNMVKSGSVYFDAVDMEAAIAVDGEHDDDCDHFSMSLCGHLLDEAKTEQDAHRIFSAHIVTSDFFRMHSTSILANPALRLLVDGQMMAYDADMQSCLVSRVLLSYSQQASVSTLPNESEANTSVSKKSEIVSGENRASTRDESRKTSPYSCSCSTLETTLDPLDEGCCDDASSSQDTASITSESYFKKSLEPSQEELREMGLRIGTNDIVFVLRSHGAGEVARMTANLYLWPVSAKVVIAQIDGAISSSAATGGMFKRRDLAAMHSGAVEFYSKLARNGYRVVYVTCHGTLQANLLQTLLHRNAGETRELALPMGPVLLSPHRLLNSYSNETIDTQGFEVAALDALRSLFPRCVNPFYAAFGTSDANSVVFTQVGVFSGKVFVVDAVDGSLRHRSLMGFHESYTSLLNRVDVMFPPTYSPMTQSLSSSPSSAQSILRTLQSVPSSLCTSSRAFSIKDELVSEATASVRSLVDEAYNDTNFWRLKPGHV